jgi:uncharacterized membrane protein YhiD involved in acid resistance
MEFFSSANQLDNQSITLIGFSVLLAFLLSSLLVFTYEKVSRDVVTPDHFLQSLILMSIVTTMIMQSIGDSPARGFGIFGALAILRFRTQLISPRNISFIFAAMAVGIACGVYSFSNAIIGTLAFSLGAFFLRLTPFSRKNNLRGQLRIEVPAEAVYRQQIETTIRPYSKRFVLKRMRVIPELTSGEPQVEYLFELNLPNEMKGLELTKELSALESAKNVRLFFDDTYINLYD